MGGVAISGRRGTGKSVMARGLHSLLPPIEVVKRSAFNIDKESGELDSFLQQEIDSGSTTVEELQTEIIPPPFVQVPLDVLEDRLLGAVDVEKSVSTGKTIFEPGLLARAHRGVLYVDDINLLDDACSNILLEALSTGWVNVEREGLSVRHPCRPILIATFNPEENELRTHLLDRFGTCLSADATPLTAEERLEAVQRALEFQTNARDFVNKFADAEQAVRTSLLFARESLKDVELSREQLLYLCQEASRARAEGHRAEIFAAEAARANAALSGRERVEAEDLKMAVKLCIAPRALEVYVPQPDEQMQPPQPPPPPPQEQSEEQEDQEEPEEQQEDTAPTVPEEFMFTAEGVALDPELLKFASKGKSGQAGSRSNIFSDTRGRYVKAMMPKGRVKRVAVDATLRAAAPLQRGRRQRQQARFERGERKDVRAVYIEKYDLRSKRLKRKAGALVVFVVDASGSMALNRMSAAKGAAITLLAQAYKSRDKIALITFSGDYAQVILPPTRSISMARSRLEKMPCGGGSPLAHALNLAARLGINAQKMGDIGEVLVVCISDGRANIPLSTSTASEPLEEPEPLDKEKLKEEVIKTAKLLGRLPRFKIIMLDTEDQFVSTGLAQEIATASRGRYFRLPKASHAVVADVASMAVEELKLG